MSSTTWRRCAADDGDIAGLDLASGDRCGDLGARPWSELVAGIQRHQRNAMSEGADGTHLVQGLRCAAFAGEHGDVDVLIHRARLVRLDPTTRAAVRVVARDHLVAVAVRRCCKVVAMPGDDSIS